MMRSLLLLFACASFAFPLHAATTQATIQTTLGTIELELFDSDKPITVSNFVKYATSGEYTNQFIQRWAPGFVIQAGGFRVTNTTEGLRIAQVPPRFGAIKNEYSVGRTFSNTYGTIAMARQAGAVNSATSQWFINLGDNSDLDTVDEGFTVFGRVIAGTNVVNLFVPNPPENDIYRLNLGSPGLVEVPILTNQVNSANLFENLVYFEVKLRRDLGLTITPNRPGQRRITWNTVAGVTNVLEVASAPGGPWTAVTNIVGTGLSYNLIDASAEARRVYRVKLFY